MAVAHVLGWRSATRRRGGSRPTLDKGPRALRLGQHPLPRATQSRAPAHGEAHACSGLCAGHAADGQGAVRTFRRLVKPKRLGAEGAHVPAAKGGERAHVGGCMLFALVGRWAAEAGGTSRWHG